MRSSSPLELVIADGPQRGAKLSLQAGCDVRIGSAFDNDVVLRDPSIPAHAVLLRVTSESCQWQAMDATLDGDISGSPLAFNKSVSVTNGANVRLGDSVLLVLSAGDMPDTDARSSGTDQAAEAVEKPPKHRLRFRALFMMASVFALTGVAAANWWQRSHLPEVASLPSIATLLAASPFRELEANTSADITIVEGFVNTQREMLEVAELLKGAGQPVQLDIVVGEKLARAVEDVYRTSGVDAEVVATGADVVEVRTSIADVRKLDALENAVRTDVPQVSSLKLTNIPPEQSDSSSDLPTRNLPIDPGKRVAMVVSNEPAYLLTADGSRYFVGSLLPSGQQISDIDNGRVLLEQNGQTTELEF